MTEVKNIDDLISASLVGTPAPEPTKVREEVNESPEPEVTEVDSNPDQVDKDSQEADKESSQEAKELSEPATESSDEVAESAKDDYGNDVSPPKTYTEEEVQRMIRERLARGRHADQQPTQQQVEKIAQDFQADPNSADDWQTQLKGFIKQTLTEVNQEARTLQWKAEEDQIQAKFEEKFTSGMNRYKDFHEAVGKMPIDDDIMMATRGMDDPAAFLYAASKTQPDALIKIAQMRDPYAKALEIGKLDEKMRKARNAVTKAPTPVKVVKGNMPDKGGERPSIDNLIRSHAKQKLNERRR